MCPVVKDTPEGSFSVKENNQKAKKREESVNEREKREEMEGGS
jgi:hypothetical protein